MNASWCTIGCLRDKCHFQLGSVFSITAGLGGHRQLWEMGSPFYMKGFQGGSVDSTPHPTKADGEHAHRGGEPCR